MKTKLILNSLFGLILGLVIFVPGSLAAAFGVAPPWITNENLKPGSNFVYVIDLNTNDPAMDMNIRSELKGSPEILKWVSIRNKENLKMPAGQQHVPMYVDVNVPADAKVGKYKGDISVTVVPMNIEREDVSIFLGGHITIELDVTNKDITDYWIKSVSVDPIVVGQPLTLNISVKNLGNTTISNVKTKVEIVNKEEKVITSKTADALSRPIYPQTVDEAKISMPIEGLSDGNYWANVTVYKGNDTIYQNKLYLPVTSVDLNNVLTTSVKVSTEDELKAAASNPYGIATANDSVKTTVTVRTPLTNQLIGVIIIFLGILIVITARMEIGIFKSLKKKRRK